MGGKLILRLTNTWFCLLVQGASALFRDAFVGDDLAELFPQAGVWVPLLYGNNSCKLVMEFLSFLLLEVKGTNF